MTKIIGHRGAKGHYAENTLLSFQKALEAGADGLELDVHFSADGHLMVFHDFELQRMTGQPGMIKDYGLAELKKFSVHFQDQSEPIPTLQEVLEYLSTFDRQYEKKTLLNVELKAGSHFYPGIESRVLELCEAYLPKEQLIYSSFDHHALVKLRELAPDAALGVLTDSSMVDPWLYVKRLRADYYHPNWMSLWPEDIRGAAAQHMPINTYTVDSPEVAKRLIEAGLYSIITNYPEEMLTLRGQLSNTL
ncbi:MAG: glycerophosphoryl diester phosphodiesterase [Clostridiales bacterium]|jgi:glycerophosphoryl diester phosphodiesterase|nr:glycerophosphoryl diester phosphodiesterase [Clostridiales bacterium]